MAATLRSRITDSSSTLCKELKLQDIFMRLNGPNLFMLL